MTSEATDFKNHKESTDATVSDLIRIFGKFEKKMDDRFDAVQFDISELKTEVSEIKLDISGLKSDVSELKYDVGSMKQDISVMKTDISETKTDISELKSLMLKVVEKVLD